MVTLRELGVRVRASVILMRSNFHDLTATRELAKSLDCEPVLDFILVPRSNGDTDVLRQRIDDSAARDVLSAARPPRSGGGLGAGRHTTRWPLSVDGGHVQCRPVGVLRVGRGRRAAVHGFRAEVRQRTSAAVLADMAEPSGRRAQAPHVGAGEKCMSCEIAASCIACVPAAINGRRRRCPHPWRMGMQKRAILHTVRETLTGSVGRREP